MEPKCAPLALFADWRIFTAGSTGRWGSARRGLSRRVGGPANPGGHLALTTGRRYRALLRRGLPPLWNEHKSTGGAAARIGSLERPRSESVVGGGSWQHKHNYLCWPAS